VSKPSSIWLRKSTGWWMTTINDIQHKLSKDEGVARKAFYKLMARDEPAATRSPERHSVRWLADKFLTRTKASKTDETFRIQLELFKKFCQKFGTRPSDSLKAHEVNEWLDEKAWETSTKALAVTIIKAAFNFAVSEDYLTESSLKKLKRRKIARRERVLSSEEEETLLKNAVGCFRDFVFVLLKTGMRPFSEAAKLTAAMINWEEGSAVLKEHKNAGKGKTRVVYFAPEVLNLLKKLAACHREGPLLRNARDVAWRRDTMYSRVTRLCEEIGMDHFNVYALRASFITNAIIKGVPVEVVAELVGTSAKMIWAHYSAVNKKTDALKAAALKAVS
jgi:integrase